MGRVNRVKPAESLRHASIIRLVMQASPGTCILHGSLHQMGGASGPGKAKCQYPQYHTKDLQNMPILYAGRLWLLRYHYLRDVVC